MTDQQREARPEKRYAAVNPENGIVVDSISKVYDEPIWKVFPSFMAFEDALANGWRIAKVTITEGWGDE